MYIKGPYRKKRNPWFLPILVVVILLPAGVFLKGCLYRSEAKPPPKPQKKPISNHVLIIDPGHGGTDPGACREGIMEKDINLAIAKRVAKHIEGHRVRLTREKDVDFVQKGVYTRDAERQDLESRIDLAQKYHGEVFVSIHINTGEGQDSGVLVYYDPKDPASTRLAQAIQLEANNLPDSPDKKPRPDDFYLFNNLKIPVVIVEAGWLCNPTERKRLMDPVYQEQVANAIARGITNFLDTL
ncbi:cell wall hydrolase/autolysin [Desulforamulus reducens MI-1]|uniref:Cell wall hydrolase/autolysin n=2 Tax=Desulforamulus TaxID=2916693 RepID=A4J7N3_DESRM|nr:cell wall hydrolase/autolysin [Desulforamulus reducens MI-1]